MADNFWERLSGTSRQSYGPSLYDPKEMKKWQDEQDKWYKDIGTNRARYGTERQKWMDRYDTAIGEADRYRGLAETDFGRARGEIDRATDFFGRAEGDISRARQAQMSANALMEDRDHYANLKSRAEARRRGIRSDRLEMQSLRGRTGRPAQDRGMTQSLLDAFKGANESNKAIMEQRTAELARTNPAAAARMQQQFNTDTLRSVGQLKQRGMITDQQLSDANLTREAGLLMDSTALYGQEAAQDAMIGSLQQQQIQNYGAAATGALNVAGSMGNVGRNYLSSAGQLATLGSQYAGMGSQMEGRGSRALGVGMQYEGMDYGALQDQMSIANQRVNRQDQFRLSDQAARARVDSFNRSRGQMGIANVLKVAETGARIYGAASTAGATEQAIAAARARRNRGLNNPDNLFDEYINQGSDVSPNNNTGTRLISNTNDRGVNPHQDSSVQNSAREVTPYNDPGLYGGLDNTTDWSYYDPRRHAANVNREEEFRRNQFRGPYDRPRQRPRQLSYTSTY